MWSILLSDLFVFRSFLGQCPPTILALILVIWKLEITPQQICSNQSHFSKLRRIDFLGSIFLSVSIVCGLMVLDLGGHRMSWTDLKLLSLLGISVAGGILFFLVEGFWAKEPIFPLRLLRNRDVLTSYINLGFQSGAQMAVCGFLNMCLVSVTNGWIDDDVSSNLFSSHRSCDFHNCRCTSHAFCNRKCNRRSPRWIHHP